MCESNKEIDILVDVLCQRAREARDKTVLLFLEQGEEEKDKLTYGDLDRDARKIASFLLSISKPGERALLIYPSGLDFVRAFYGCLYSGIIPIPTNPPGRNSSMQRLLRISKDAQASIALTTNEFVKYFDQEIKEFPDLRSLKWISHDNFASGLASLWKKPDITPDSIAFIQYTSGSTTTPRGVMISYRNLSCNKNLIRELRKRELSADSVIVTWPPLFHDMGLLRGVIQCVFDNNLSVLMSPIAFMQRPVRWLEAITKYKGTFSGGPNFSYDVCVNKVTPNKLAQLDLSSWKVASNAGEPIRIETQDRFARKFANCGFEYEAFYPCYGLAEATLLVSGYGGKGRSLTYPANRTALEEGRIDNCDPADKNCRPLVNCGPPLLDTKIAIIDPKTRLRCLPGKVGEIWISGDNIGQGYWNQPDETERTFRARIKDTGEGPFVRTGDIGFLHNGDLYVTGRFKDLIIIRGRNYYPQDIEFTVEKSNPVLQPGGGAAICVNVDGYEQVVVLQEVKRQYEEYPDFDEVIKKIRIEIAKEHGIRIHTVVLIKRGTIPKTSSGKIMRHESYNKFMANDLEIVAEWRAPIR
jgi:acyl-CoA synthetase (AMP-forming)/AMP-acid ligase II